MKNNVFNIKHKKSSWIQSKRKALGDAVCPSQASLHTFELYHPARLRRDRRWKHIGQGDEHPFPWLFLPLQSASKPHQCHLQRKEGRGHSAGAHQSPFAQPSISHRPCRSPAVAHMAQGGDTGCFEVTPGSSLLCGVCLLLMLCPCLFRAKDTQTFASE